MNPNPLFLATRAISVEFANRIYYPVVIGGGAVLFVLVGGSVWLVTMSAWWLFLMVPLMLLFLLFATLSAITGFILRFIQPTVNKSQKTEIKSFVDKLQTLSETVQTPKFILLFRLIKDVVFPNNKGFVKELSANAISMRPDFDAIVASFR